MKTFSNFLLAFLVVTVFLNIFYATKTFAQDCDDPSCAEAASSLLLPQSPGVSGAADFEPLAGLPGITSSAEKRTLADYVNALFRLAIGLAALLAVIKITVAGIKYMTSDAFSSKESAKSDITNSLLGLLIILSTVVILQLIYPGILNLNALQGLPPLENLVYTPPFEGIGSSTTVDPDVTRAELEEDFADFDDACREGGGRTAINIPGSFTGTDFVNIAIDVVNFTRIPERFVIEELTGIDTEIDSVEQDQISLVCKKFTGGTTIEEDEDITEEMFESRVVLNDGEEVYGAPRVLTESATLTQERELVEYCRLEIADELGIHPDDVDIGGEIQDDGTFSESVLREIDYPEVSKAVYHCAYTSP